MSKKSQDLALSAMDNCSTADRTQFEQHVAAFNQAHWGEPLQVFLESGIDLPAPNELADADLTEKLWETIQLLALIGVYLEHTDHLSDRELYQSLWDDCLREEMPFQSENLQMVCHYDLIGSGSEEDMYIFLKFYADEQERLDWLKDFPDLPLPKPTQLLYDRDRHLPKPKQRDNLRLH